MSLEAREYLLACHSERSEESQRIAGMPALGIPRSARNDQYFGGVT
jgi:hypothetical protein